MYYEVRSLIGIVSWRQIMVIIGKIPEQSRASSPPTLEVWRVDKAACINKCVGWCINKRIYWFSLMAKGSPIRSRLLKNGVGRFRANDPRALSSYPVKIWKPNEWGFRLQDKLICVLCSYAEPVHQFPFLPQGGLDFNKKTEWEGNCHKDLRRPGKKVTMSQAGESAKSLCSLCCLIAC